MHAYDFNGFVLTKNKTELMAEESNFWDRFSMVDILAAIALIAVVGGVIYYFRTKPAPAQAANLGSEAPAQAANLGSEFEKTEVNIATGPYGAPITMASLPATGTEGQQVIVNGTLYTWVASAVNIPGSGAKSAGRWQTGITTAQAARGNLPM